MEKFDPIGAQTTAEVVKISAETVSHITKDVSDNSIEAVRGFLSKTCLPALEQLGFLLGDKVRAWRLNNMVRVIEKAQGKIHFDPEKESLSLNPRVVIETIENASLCDDEELQNMWAGLIASSSQTGERNIIFIQLLKKLTSTQAAFLDYIVKNSKVRGDKGLLIGSDIEINIKTLYEIFKTTDIEEIDIELDHLYSIQLTDGRFILGESNNVITINATALCLNLYMRANGFGGRLTEFYTTN